VYYYLLQSRRHIHGPILSQPYHSNIKIVPLTLTLTLTPTEMEMETKISNRVDDHSSEVLITKELNQLSFKDRNDYQGK
jgi:hypothetical protein